MNGPYNLSRLHMRRRRGYYVIEVEGTQTLGYDEHEISYTATVRINYQPAQLYGPPENCYPDESEVEIESLVTVPPGFENIMDTGKIEDQAWDEFLTGDRL